MARLDNGALSRAVRGLSVDPARALDRRRSMLGFDALQEIEQQFQLPIEGVATPVIVWDIRDIAFEVEFYNATEQRFSPYTVPVFTYGAVIETPTPVPVHANVMEWKKRDDDAVTGVRLAIGVHNPGHRSVAFSGYLHLVFQGYGALAEGAADLDVSGG